MLVGKKIIIINIVRTIRDKLGFQKLGFGLFWKFALKKVF